MNRVLFFLLFFQNLSVWILPTQARPEYKNVPAQLFLEMVYYNPYEHASSGWCDIWPHDRGCDIYFVICISNGSGLRRRMNLCDIAKKMTAVYGDKKRLNLQGDDMVQIPLAESLPEKINIRIEAWDQDKMSSDDHIATYLSQVVLNGTNKFEKINLTQIHTTWHNKEIQLDVWFKVVCTTYYYGPRCTVFCKPDYKTFLCSENGTRICYPGYRGESCQNIDYCYREPCASNAQCANNEDGSGRTCYCNGGSGPECYEITDTCNPSPCLNGGTCIKTGLHLQQFRCECVGHFYGVTCEMRFSSCEAARIQLLQLSQNQNNTNIGICLNNGRCVDHQTEYAHYCECPRGWKGDNCEIPDATMAIAVSLVIVFVILILCVIFFFWRCWRHKKAKHLIGAIRHERHSNDCNEKPGASISNEVYSHLSMLSASFPDKCNSTFTKANQSQGGETANEYNHLTVDAPHVSWDPCTTSTTSIRFSKQKRNDDDLNWHDADIYEAPNDAYPDCFESNGHFIHEKEKTGLENPDIYEELHIDGPKSLGTSATTDETVPGDRFHDEYDYVSTNNAQNHTMKVTDVSSPDYLPPLPIRFATFSNKGKK